MSLGNITGFINFKEGYSPSYDDYNKSIKLINCFFDNYIIPNIRTHSWDVCITVARRGSQLYTDQRLSKRELQFLYTMSDFGWQDCAEAIIDKSVMIFDDSIKDGTNIRRILSSISPITSKITIAVLLSREDTLENLKSEFPHVKFHTGINVSEKEFSREYLKKIQPYLDSICLPIQRDHPLLTISFEDSFDEQAIAQVFSRYGYIGDDECKKFEYIDGDKKLFEFREDVINGLSIIKSLKHLGIIQGDAHLEDLVIIRLYFRRGLVRQLIMQPIILEQLVIPKGGSIDLIDNFVKSQLIYQFLIYTILPELMISEKILRYSVILGPNEKKKEF